MKTMIFISTIILLLTVGGCDQSKVESNLSFDEYVNIAKVSLSEGNLEKGITAYKKALGIRPNDSHVHFRLGEIYKNEWWRTYNLANKKYQIDLLTQPNFNQGDDTTQQLINYGLKNEYMALAVEEFKETVKYDPANWEARYFIACQLAEKKQYFEAIDELNKVVQFNPAHCCVYGLLGDAYEEVGKYNLAITNYRKHYQINRNDELYFFNLGKIYYRMGDIDKAVEMFKRLREMKSEYATKLLLFKDRLNQIHTKQTQSGTVQH